MGGEGWLDTNEEWSVVADNRHSVWRRQRLDAGFRCRCSLCRLLEGGILAAMEQTRTLGLGSILLGGDDSLW